MFDPKDEDDLAQALALEFMKMDFLTLCKGYEALGKFLKDLGPIIVPPSVYKTFQSIFLQYNQVGEQLKEVSEGIDIFEGPFKKKNAGKPGFKPGRFFNGN